MNNELKQAMDASVPDTMDPNEAFLRQPETQNASMTLPSVEERKSLENTEEAKRKTDSLKPLV